MAVSWPGIVEFRKCKKSCASSPLVETETSVVTGGQTFWSHQAKLSVGRPKICLFLPWCKFAATTHCRPKLGRRQKAESFSLSVLFCYFVCVLLAASLVALCQPFVCAISSSARELENNLLSFGQDIDPRERHLHLCHSHTYKKLVHPPFSLSSPSQIVKQVASHPFVFSGSHESVFLLSVLIIVAILERSLVFFSGESTYLPW